jgi:hypothetical protein
LKKTTINVVRPTPPPTLRISDLDPLTVASRLGRHRRPPHHTRVHLPERCLLDYRHVLQRRVEPSHSRRGNHRHARRDRGRCHAGRPRLLMAKSKKKSPTALSLERLRAEGFIAQVVEQTIPHCFIKRDFIGCIDLIAFNKERDHRSPGDERQQPRRPPHEGPRDPRACDVDRQPGPPLRGLELDAARRQGHEVRATPRAARAHQPRRPRRTVAAAGGRTPHVFLCEHDECSVECRCDALLPHSRDHEVPSHPARDDDPSRHAAHRPRHRPA